MPNSTQKIEKRLKETISNLSPKNLEQVADFAEYLRSREEWEATMEILNDPEMRKKVDHGIEEDRQGKVRSWREIKNNV